ncbi:hypothetical protein TrVE_jg10971 [Triparma verrucosa]|uniref:Uncharacterized protein n=1 Tax=Triparma verrucosa TaxID=1606542 RepID=A0A9W7FLW4_9STRA|nr:hypothetical protein TrVE_jg10971 [Triparma verrucosa]
MSACLPTSSKRRRNPSSSIPENPISTDFNSAAEYLAYVQNQADSCPKIVTAEPDPVKNHPPKPSAKVSTSTLSFTSFSPSPQAKPPSEEWILSTYRTFQEASSYIKSIPISKSTPPKHPTIQTTLPLPPLKDYITWNVLLLHPSSLPSIPSFLQTPLPHSLYHTPSTRSEYDNLSPPLPPLPPPILTTSLLKRFDQVMLLRIISHLTRPLHLPQPPIILERLETIYVLLTHLEMPVHRDTSYLLRDMGKKITEVRARGEEIQACDVLLSVLVGLGQVGMNEVFTVS